jgi:hypothetical protein
MPVVDALVDGHGGTAGIVVIGHPADVRACCGGVLHRLAGMDRLIGRCPASPVLNSFGSLAFLAEVARC